jgi:hypothetical protein
MDNGDNGDKDTLGRCMLGRTSSRSTCSPSTTGVGDEGWGEGDPGARDVCAKGGLKVDRPCSHPFSGKRADNAIRACLAETRRESRARKLLLKNGLLELG